MSELPGYSPYGVPPPAASSTSSLAPSTSASASTAPVPPSTDPPTYLPQPILRTTRHNLAGPIQTVSLSDKQHDYFLATRTSPTTYTLSLTSDPTPLYRIEISPSPASDPAIQLFDFHDPFPLAAARMPPFVTTFASVCTREPAGAGAVWHRMTDSHGVLAVEIVPGLPVVNRDVVWSTPRLTTGLTCTLLGSLFGWDGDGVTLARYGMTGPGFRADMVFDILRGGGIEFELGIVMQVFVKLEADRRKLEKKGKGKGKKGM
ncbi:hypothetical protein VE01_02165 [Pseudogymnoascus verrucosus]|uniref:Uncharacterized protein n=1 Tax=Pseudogymnoascus verrucosus TaxID=342668 RepID=A0A1B8GV12_9PEZI|nr:uncharacterized protein VE01_02165 [Pseudogymnoascus verrucosus]OBT99666.1 hypothetical protein VE01_02165 [Pseudogymnoascus verrucosus]